MIAHFLMLALAATDLFAPGQAWVCEMNAAQICNEDGCVSESRPAEISLYPEAKSYRLCIDGDCQDYGATYYAYRGSMVIKIDDEPGYARMFPDLTLVDVSDVGKSVQISRGSCRVDDPPVATTPDWSPI